MTLLADILAQVTLARVFVFSFLFLVISFIVDLVSQPRYPDSIPVLGHDSKKWFSTIRNSFAYFTQHQAWTGEGYEKYGKNGLPFIAPAPLSRPPDVVLPRSQVAWMMNQPDHILSAAHAHDKIMHSEYNFLGKDLTEDDFGPRVVHKYLARHLPALVPAIADETNSTVQDALETLIKAAAEKNPKNVDAEGFTKVNLWEMWLAIVPRITNRLLVGETICRDPSFIDSMVRFTDDVVRNSFLLHAFPQVLHPIIGRLITIPNYLHWRTAARRVVPIIEQRIKDMQRKEAGDPEMKNWSPPEDYFTWHIRLAMAEGNAFELDPIVVSKRILPINFAAIHTTVLTGHSWMLDLWSLSPDGRALDTLRDELKAHRPTEGPWTKQSLASLVRLDSSFRESQRLSNFAANLVERQVIAPEGLHNPDYGWTLPQGAFVTLNLQGTHHDDEIFEGAMKYNPWRYSNSREEWGRKTAEEKKENEKEGLRVKGLGMVTISDTHLAFGLGRHACPGRFFVAHELKLIAAKLLLDYDIKTIEARPKAQWLGATIIPPLDACIEIRPRASRR